jgi:chemotaxis protein methyltransferase WspC
MRSLELSAVSSYAALVTTSAEELETLIEMVVIPETWFFRDREPFVFLAHFIQVEWKPFRGKDTLRILSAPCATGEEPYSIAITCLNCGLKPGQFVVDAADINAKFLQKARQAVYGRNSFRGTEPEFRQNYFANNGPEYALKPEVRACVHFFKANILEPESFPGSAHYNIVFCRNFLIYLHDQARSKTIAIIERLIAPGGLLFIGHAEVTPTLTEIYETVNHQGSFALRKPVAGPVKNLYPAMESR